MIGRVSDFLFKTESDKGCERRLMRSYVCE